MKKFFCLLICSLWLYSCSDDSNPTGNDFSNMKFESVSILVEGMKFNYTGIGFEGHGSYYHYDTLNEDRSFDYGLTLSNSETVNIVNVDGVYSYSGQTADGYTRRLSFNLNKDTNLIDTLWSQCYKFTQDRTKWTSSGSNDENYITLVNLPYTVGVNGEITVELVAPLANNIIVNYWHRKGWYSLKDGYDHYAYDGATKEFLGFTDSAYIKIVLTPAK